MKRLLILAVVVFAASCAPKTPKPEIAIGDPLPSWNETASKKLIVDFVRSVTSPDSEQFIPVEERIAVFDNDGTLWCEQPLYFEMLYSIEATAAIARENLELQKTPEIKAIATGDKEAFLKSGEKGILEAFALSHTAVGIDRFDEMARQWLDTARHPRFKQRYIDLTYKPMVELLGLLRANDFKTYIVSGGSTVFMRNFTARTYGIPPENVIGTMFKAKYSEADRSIALSPEVWHMDDGPGKPEAIFQIIGRKPILAFGNSDGDLQMLQWTGTNTRRNLKLILRHTDADREYAYDRTSKIGTLNRALDEGEAEGWVIVDMKEDFKKVFSYE